MSLLTQFETQVSLNRYLRESKLDSLFDFSSAHLIMLQSLSKTSGGGETCQDEEGSQMQASIREYVNERNTFRRQEIYCQQCLEASRDLRQLAKENHHLRQAQEQQVAGVKGTGGVSLMDFTVSIAPTREHTRVLSGDMLASHISIFSALETKRKSLDSVSLKYNQLLSLLQKSTNSKMLRSSELLKSSEIQTPLSEIHLEMLLEMQLTRRLMCQLKQSLSQLSFIDSATLPFNSSNQRPQRKKMRLNNAGDHLNNVV